MPELGILALVIIAFAFATFSPLLMKRMTEAMSGVPIIGPYISAILRPVSRAISWACGQLLTGLEQMLTPIWHGLAAVLDYFWLSYQSANALFVRLAQVLHIVGQKASGTHAGVSNVNRRLHTLEHAFVQQGRELHGIDAKVKELERDISGGIGADVQPQLKHLQNELDTAGKKEATDIANTRAAADSAISDLWAWLAGVGSIPVSLTFADAIAVALGTLGLGGLRCSNFKNLLSKFGCGLGTLLNDLLGLMIAGLFLESVCEFLPQFEAAFGAVVGPITELLTNTPLGNCEQVPASWSHLDVAAGPLPPGQTLGTFPS